MDEMTWHPVVRLGEGRKSSTLLMMIFQIKIFYKRRLKEVVEDPFEEEYYIFIVVGIRTY